MKFNLLVILGPTASGKTKAAVEVARSLGGEIISADSRQVYRGMDIGTGKDINEYGSVGFHLIDIVDPGYEFSVFEFQRRFLEASADIRARSRLPILAGGTGMYIDAVLSGFQMFEVPENPELRAALSQISTPVLADRLKQANPKLHNTTDLLDRDRLIRAIEIAEYGSGKDAVRPLTRIPDLRPIVFGIRWERAALRERITRRLRERLQNGMVEEARALIAQGVSFETLDFYGLEYRYLGQYLQGKMNRNDLFQKLNSAIHRFAKRQETYFRHMERQGISIHWVEGNQDPARAILEATPSFSDPSDQADPARGKTR